MALAGKGTRRITVDGVEYRWRVRGRPTYSQAMGWTPLVYAVAHADEPGTTLVVTTDRARPDRVLGERGAPVLPSEVAAAVRRALERGWRPAKPGTPFRLAPPESPPGTS